MHDHFSFYQKCRLVIPDPVTSDLQLFPYVFQEYPEALCGKSEISADDCRNQKEMGIVPEGYEGQKDPSHLQMPRLQTEKQGSEGKRENRDPLPEVSNGIYQEELTGEKYVRVRNC